MFSILSFSKSTILYETKRFVLWFHPINPLSKFGDMVQSHELIPYIVI